VCRIGPILSDVTTVLLLRHGRSTANAQGVLAGRNDSELDETGRDQALDLANRLADVPLDILVTSPQLRARQTAQMAAAGRAEAVVDDAFAECDYGDWSGAALSELATEPAWEIVQWQPSAAQFPAGETMAQMAHRATHGVRQLVSCPPAGIRVGRHPRRCHQGHRGRRAGGASGPFPAHRDRHRLGERDHVLTQASRSSSGSTTPDRYALRVNRTTKVRTRSSVAALRSRVEPVTRRILSFSHPQRFVVGTVGQPGDRTFFLQVSDAGAPVSVVCEKEQASVLAEKVLELLDQVRRSGVEVPDDADEELIDTDPLQQPIDPEFRVSAMGIGWDPTDEAVIIEAHGESESDDVPDIGDDGEGPDTLRVRLTPVDALAFSIRTSRVVAAGRPQCPFCHLPIDPDGHICPRANGYRRHLA
jgi:uncharacterized repeat protein (TIGR03847 family)